MALPVIFDKLKTSDPEFYELLGSLKDLAMEPGALDKKTKLLLGLAINVCLERTDKVQCALGQARAAGAAEEEVREVMRLTYFIKGIPTAELMTRTL